MQIFSKRPLAFSSLALFLSSLFTYLFIRSGNSPLWGLLPLLFLFLASSVLLRTKRCRSPLLLLLLAMMLVGILSQTVYNGLYHKPFRDLEGGRLHTMEGRITEKEEGADGVIYTIQGKLLNDKPTYIRVLLSLGDDMDAEIGDILSFRFAIASYADRYEYGDSIAGSVLAKDLPDIIGHEDRWLTRGISSLRRFLSERLCEGTNRSTGSLLTALLLGERESLPSSVQMDFRRTSLSHILALSGMHLSLLTAVLLWLLHTLSVPRRVYFPFLVLFIFFYVLITGVPLSLLRAALMLTLYEAARLFRLFSDSVTALFFSLAVIVTVMPAAVGDLGLSLSFLATLGILVAIQAFPCKRALRNFGRRLFRIILFSLFSTCFALMFTLLLSALAFGRISLLSPLSNLIIAAPTEALLIVGPILLLFPNLLAPLAEWLADLTLELVSGLSSLGGHYVSITYPVFLLALLLFSLYVLLLLILPLKSQRAFLSRLSCASLLLVLCFLGCHMAEERNDLLLYTRYYESEYITLRTEGRVTVVCSATSPNSVYSLEDDLADAHITEIDTLVLTHYEKDTANQLFHIAERIYIHRILFLPTDCEASEPYYREARLAAELLRIECPETSKNVFTDGGLTLTVVAAVPSSATSPLLLSLSYDETDILLASSAALDAYENAISSHLVSGAEVLILSARPQASGSGMSLTPTKGQLIISAHPERFGISPTAAKNIKSDSLRIRFADLEKVLPQG